MNRRFLLSGVPQSLFFITPLIIHVVVGLVATKKFAPTPFTKYSVLPALGKISDVSNSTPPRNYSLPLPVVYTNEIYSAEQWVSDYVNPSALSTPVILGWDMESTPHLPWLKHKYTEDSYFGPALIQLSTVDSSLVFQIGQDGFGPIHEGGLPKFLHEILQNPKIIPSGVGIDDDMIQLYRWCLEHGEEPAWASSDSILRRFDMGRIGAKSMRSTVGLSRLVEGVLGVGLPKDSKMAQSHWSKKPPLTRFQVAYAARDAWAAAAVVECLADMDERFEPSSILSRLDEKVGLIEYPLRCIREISERQYRRKTVRTEWEDLKNPYDAEGNMRPQWTPEQKARHDWLRKELGVLAPTGPIRYEVEKSLGLKI